MQEMARVWVRAFHVLRVKLSRLARRCAVTPILVILLIFGEAPFAVAQQVLPAPQAQLIDSNGVNLQAPHIQVPEPALAIGQAGSGGLGFSRVRPLIHFATIGGDPVLNWVGSNLSGYVSVPQGLSTTMAASFAGVSEIFGTTIGGVTPTSGPKSHDGSKLELVAGKYILTSADGTVMTFDTAINCQTGFMGADGSDAALMYGGLINGSYKVGAWIKKVEKPDGEVIDWNYVDISSSAISDACGAKGQRLQSVTNNLGYMIHFKYKSETAVTLDDYRNWATVEKITAIDTTTYACSPTASSCNEDGGGASWPTLTYARDPTGSGLVYTVTDRLSDATRYTYTRFATNGVDVLTLASVASPANPASDLSFSISGLGAGYTPSGYLALTNSAGTWNYTYGTSTGRTTVSGPGGYSRSVLPLASTDKLPFIEEDNINGYQVGYVHDGLARLTQTNYPDGRITYVDYDVRRNVVHTRQIAAPGSGLSEIHQYASYPAAEAANEVCANAKTCNRPQWVTVPGAASSSPSSLPKSDYAYDTSAGPTFGFLLSETKPAPGSGPYASVRPQMRYTYDATGGVVRRTAVKSCMTMTSCAGTADEVVDETTYNAKRLPSLVVMRAGNNTTPYTDTNARSATTYTPQGDVESVDGPDSGAADKVWYFYDTMRRLRVAVSMDPDGAGSLVYRAIRTTYDADGQVVMIEQGSVNLPSSCSAANSFCATAMTVLAKSTIEYDSFGRKLRENAFGSASTPQSVVQYSYVAGRVECVATRMNTAVYGSLPVACTQSTAGSLGPDPITRTTYTANGDPSTIQTGYGTTQARNEQTITYLAPGQVGTLKDAANNLTTYEYDGFSRLKKVRYPATSVGAGTSSTTDYEQYGYDAAGNDVSERRRDGLTVANTYDVLNRLRFIDRPGAELDVTNSYDNLDHLTAAVQTGSSVTWVYNALGYVTSETQGLGTVAHTYDTAGRRTQLTYPGSGFYTNYQYFDDGRLKLIGVNGATTGSGVLATYYDDQLGRRVSMCRGTGTTSSCTSVARTAYSYDAVSRLTGLSHDLITGGAANDASWTLSYSPASQLTSRAASSTVYEWPYSATFTDAYTVNGLNQYTAAAGPSLTYDGRGNTTNDTTKTYTYDSSNMLTSASNGATLAYDPIGRLLSVTLSGTTTKFLYDGTHLIAEYNGSNALLRRYVHADGVDDPIVWYDSSGATNKRDLFKDERGSVVAADTGTTVTYMRYDEYGNPSGNYTGRFTYTGQTWLAEVGLYYYKARMYNPDLGRFLQTDPVSYSDGMNLYGYAKLDPLSKKDPSGKTCYDVSQFFQDSPDRMGTRIAIGAFCFDDLPWRDFSKLGNFGTIKLSFGTFEYTKTKDYRRCPKMAGDYSVGSVTVGLPVLGVNQTVIIDKYGRQYAGLGLSYIGGLGASGMAYWLPFQDTSPAALENFLKGTSGTLQGGAGFAGGVTANGSGVAIGAGFGTPGVAFSHDAADSGQLPWLERDSNSDRPAPPGTGGGCATYF